MMIADQQVMAVRTTLGMAVLAGFDCAKRQVKSSTPKISKMPPVPPAAPLV